jgi:hypothetical protein
MDQTAAQGDGPGQNQLAAANAENEDAFAGSGDPSGGEADDEAFSNDHPLASPTELAGTTEHAIEAEFAARDVIDAQSDAAGAASGIDYEEDTLPLEGN